MTLPKPLRLLCKTHNINLGDIEDVLAEPSEQGGVWIVKINGDLPYATIGAEFTPHGSYADALNHSVEVLMAIKVLKAVDRRGRTIDDFDVTLIPEDPTELLIILAPKEIIDSIPALDDKTRVFVEGLGGFVEARSNKRYLLVPASDSRIDQKPVTTAKEPLHYAGRFGDKVIFTAPAEFLAERTWHQLVHRTMVEAFKKGEVQEGVRPVLLPEPARVCRLVLDLGTSPKAGSPIVAP